MNSKIHAVTDGNGKPILFEITAGNISDYTVAGRIMNDLPTSKVLLAEKGYDSNKFRNALKSSEYYTLYSFEENTEKRRSFYDKTLYKLHIMFKTLS